VTIAQTERKNPMKKYGLLFLFLGVMALPNVSFADNCTSCSTCSALLNAGTDATLSQNIGSAPLGGNNACILINSTNANGTTLDCNGKDIVGTYSDGKSGIRINGVDSVTVQNCDLKYWGLFENIDDDDYSQNEAAILLDSATNCTIQGNTINRGRNGIVLVGDDSDNTSSGNSIDDNDVQCQSFVGIAAWSYAKDNEFTRNTIFKSCGITSPYYNGFHYGISMCFGGGQNEIGNGNPNYGNSISAMDK
jgi:parallel beta-helix repeat protein